MGKGNEQQRQGKPANRTFLEGSNTHCIKEYMKICNGMEVGQRRIFLAMSPSSREKGRSSLQHVQSSLLAGVGSGTLSSIVCAPLDLIRTRMQVMGDLKNHSSSTSNPSLVSNLRDIVQMDGIRGCFRGLSATLMTVPFFWGLYFPLYEHLKHHFHDLFHSTNVKEYNTNKVTATSTSEDGSLSIMQFEEPSESILIQKRPTKKSSTEEVSSMVHLCAAISAGAVADCICNPLFVVRTRMQTEALHYMDMPLSQRKPHSIGRTVMKLYQEGGIVIFWRGLTASLLGLIHVGIQFPMYVHNLFVLFCFVCFLKKANNQYYFHIFTEFFTVGCQRAQ